MKEKLKRASKHNKHREKFCSIALSISKSTSQFKARRCQTENGRDLFLPWRTQPTLKTVLKKNLTTGLRISARLHQGPFD